VYAVPKTNLCTLSCFGGITKVIDVQREGAVVHQGQEHKTGLQNYERVWQAQPVPGNPNEYASCADDGLVKLWDIRQPKSVRTIAGHPGRVSSMGFFSPHHVVVGSCPDDPHASPTKAELCFYDLRR
jgi:WD40 repeat protein